MNLLFNIMLLFLFNQDVEQVTITGKIVENETHEPVSYVNIGLIGTTIGTVSDKDGAFKLSVPQSFSSGTIRFSIVGYESKSYLVSDFINKKDIIIEMVSRTYLMEPVTVDDSRLRQKRLGHRSTSTRIVTGWGGRPDGGERGIRIKVKNKPIYPQKLAFHIARNDLDKVLFRVNFRSIENDLPTKSLLQEDILVETELSEGWVEVDLEPYNLSFTHDVAVILQPVRSWGECRGSGHCLHLSASFLRIFSTKWLYGKDGSEGEWTVSKNYSPAIFLIVYQ